MEDNYEKTIDTEQNEILIFTGQNYDGKYGNVRILKDTKKKTAVWQYSCLSIQGKRVDYSGSGGNSLVFC